MTRVERKQPSAFLRDCFQVAVLPVFAVLAIVTSEAAMVDPTQPPSWDSPVVPRASVKRRGLELQSTLISPSRRIAIINGKRYTVGSRVGTSTVTRIKPYEVTLERAGKETHLRLLPELGKTPVIINKAKP